MNAVTKEEQTALTLPERAAVALGAADYEVKIKAKVAASTDITAVIDPAGREQAHRIGMDLLKLRTGITAAGEAARKDATAFSKAVIAKEKELVGLIAPEETRVMSLRDGWDEQIAAEKAAKIAAERARTDAIQACLQNIRDFPLQAVGKSSQEISNMIGILVASEPGAAFEEFIEQAKVARHEALDKLAAAETAQRAVEIEAESQRQEAARVAAEAEEARKAEAKRAADEAATVAAQRVENERVANEQAAERQRLADQEAANALAAKKLADKIAANLKADQDALAEQVRLQREAAAEQQRQLAAQQAEIDAKRAAFAREQEEAAARVEAAAKMEADHADALEMNAALDAAIARIEPVEKFASDDLTRCNATVASLLADNLPPPESCCARDARIDAEVVEVSDNDIINVVMWEFDWSNDEATKRMKAIDYAAAWQERLAESE